MERDRTELLNLLLESYTTWYDIERKDESETPLVAQAAFHEHGVTYFLAHKAQLWAADRHEYVYFYSTPELTEELAKEYMERTYAMGSKVVKPDGDHMTSYVVAIFICDEVTDSAAEFIRHYRRRKNFRLSLLGWMEVHGIVIDRRNDVILSNPDGRQSAKLLKDVLFPQTKKRAGKWRGIIKRLL